MKKLLLASCVSLLALSAHAEDKPVAPVQTAKAEMNKEHGEHKGMGKHHGRMSKMDTDKDGAISRAEADAFHDKMFKEMDGNKDGKITKDEKKSFHDAKKAKHQAKRDEFMKKYDTNKDGKISPEEKEAAKKAKKEERQAKKAKKEERQAKKEAAAPTSDKK